MTEILFKIKDQSTPLGQNRYTNTKKEHILVKPIFIFFSKRTRKIGKNSLIKLKNELIAKISNIVLLEKQIENTTHDKIISW